MLISVPGGDQGPGGVLVCCENFVIYKPVGGSSSATASSFESTELRTVIPRRADLSPERGVLLIASATHRSKAMVFFIVQSEYGDLYKIVLEQDGEWGGRKRVELGVLLVRGCWDRIRYDEGVCVCVCVWLLLCC